MATALRDPRLVQNIAIRRGLEGPQLIVEWDAPTNITTAMEIKVLRKQFEFAVNPFDATAQVVFEGPADAGVVTNLDLDPCKCYYYTAFTHNFFPAEEWLFSNESQVQEIAIPTGFFGRDMGMFNLLPDLYVQGDKQLEIEIKDGQIALFPVFDPDNNEWFNLGENTDPAKAPKRKGPLNRYLKTIAVDLDLAKGLTDCMPTLWDIDETCCEWLPALGELIGLRVNREFPCSAQRQEVKEHVAILKIKGTKDAIRARGRTVTGLITEVQEWGNNILISNRLSRTSMAFPNTGLFEIFKLPGDTTDYTPGGEFTFQSICVFFDLAVDDCLSQQEVEKLDRALTPELPACRTGSFAMVEGIFEETIDLDIGEVVTDIIRCVPRINLGRINCSQIGPLP